MATVIGIFENQYKKKTINGLFDPDLNLGDLHIFMIL